MQSWVKSEQMAVSGLPGMEVNARLRAQHLLASVCPSQAVPHYRPFGSSI